MVIPACRVSMASPTAPGKRLRACGRQNNSTLPRGRLCGRSGGAPRLHPRSATAKRLSFSLSSTHWIPCSSKQTGKIQFSIWYFKKCNLQIAFSFSWKTKGGVCVCVCVCVCFSKNNDRNLRWGGACQRDDGFGVGTPGLPAQLCHRQCLALCIWNDAPLGFLSLRLYEEFP